MDSWQQVVSLPMTGRGVILLSGLGMVEDVVELVHSWHSSQMRGKPWGKEFGGIFEQKNFRSFTSNKLTFSQLKNFPKQKKIF